MAVSLAFSPGDGAARARLGELLPFIICFEYVPCLGILVSWVMSF